MVSDAIVVSEASVRRLLSRICFGNIGRKGRKNHADFVLNILPKFELVAMKIYFRVFKNILLPSSIPCTITPRFFSKKTISVYSLTTSVAVSTEIATSAACSAGVCSVA
jgi:hypothetical protein